MGIFHQSTFANLTRDLLEKAEPFSCGNADLDDFFLQEPDNKTGCRYLVVDAYNTELPLAFYQKNGFKQLFSTEVQEREYRNITTSDSLVTRLMFFDLIRMV